jgi:PAS domain S-box-containing protein
MNSGSRANNLTEDIQALRAAERRYRALFENIVEGFFLAEVICDSAGEPIDYRHVDANPAFEKLTGLQHEQVIGKTAREVFPGIKPNWIKTYGRVALTGEAARLSDFFAALGRYYETVAYSPAPGQFACLFNDVTDRKRAEDALRENQQLLTFHMENTPLAVVEWGADFRVSRWSGEAERMFGWRADEVLGKRIDELRWVYDEDVQKVAAISAGLVDGTRPRSVSRNRNYRKDGSVIHSEWYNSSLVDESGKLVSILSLVLDVTERTQAEEQVRKTLESIGDGFFACDADWRIVYVNTVAESLLKMGRSDVLGRNLWEVFPLTIGTKLESEYRRAAKGELRDFEYLYEPWGRWFHNRCFPREGGGLSVYFQDITDHKRVEEESRRSTTLIRAISDTTGDLIFAKDRDGRLTFANPASLAVIGKNVEDVLGKTLAEVLADISVAREVMENEQQIIASGIAREVEEDFPMPDGSRRVLLSRKMPYRDSDGAVIGLLGIARDITERKRVEAERDRYSQQRQLALNAARMGWWHYNPATKVIVGDDRYREILQIPGYETSEEELRARIHPDDLPQALASLAAALDPANPETYLGEYRINMPDGSVRWVETHGIATFDGEGSARRATCLVGTVADITARKQGEELLMRSEKVAVLGRMAATIAHEINNPLEAVINTIFLARNEPDCPPSVLRFLSMADEELKRISHITRQALGFYRESSAPSVVSIGALLDESVDLFRSKIDAKRVTIEKQYGNGLKLTGVAGELRQIFSNLLANSLDAVPQSGTITLRASRHGILGASESFFRITIADDGKGIDPSAKPRVFEPLFTTKGPFGTGLGLWVTRQLVEKHGGSIRIRSRIQAPRRGTSISIVLPAAKIENGTTAPRVSTSATTGG